MKEAALNAFAHSIYQDLIVSLYHVIKFGIENKRRNSEGGRYDEGYGHKDH